MPSDIPDLNNPLLWCTQHGKAKTDKHVSNVDTVRNKNDARVAIFKMCLAEILRHNMKSSITYFNYQSLKTLPVLVFRLKICFGASLLVFICNLCCGSVWKKEKRKSRSVCVCVCPVPSHLSRSPESQSKLWLRAGPDLCSAAIHDFPTPPFQHDCGTQCTPIKLNNGHQVQRDPPPHHPWRQNDRALQSV